MVDLKLRADGLDAPEYTICLFALFCLRNCQNGVFSIVQEIGKVLITVKMIREGYTAGI